MKKIITSACALLLLCCCGQKPADPVKDALTQKLCADAPQGAKLRLDNVELADSTSYGTEVDRRIKVFETRISQNKGFYEKYLREGKANNAQLKSDAIVKDQARLERLLSIKENMGDMAEKTAYYDYHFSGKMETAQTSTSYNDCWFTITPEGEILSISPDRKDIHKGTGIVIPGYKELFEGGEED